MTSPIYDRIGVGYRAHRSADPRVAALVRAALGDARSVVNVGAGAGSYEPVDLPVVAVEPSPVMLAQRATGAAPAIRAVAEALPFADRRFDAAMAILTVHHWRDLARGIAELLRVASRRIVVLTWDPVVFAHGFWLVREYVPEVVEAERGLATLAHVVAALGGDCAVTPVPVPHDCRDGFFGAYWRRPEAYLDPGVRASISGFARLGADAVASATRRLADDLASGAWDARHGTLRQLDALDLGYRLVVRTAG